MYEFSQVPRITRETVYALNFNDKFIMTKVILTFSFFDWSRTVKWQQNAGSSLLLKKTGLEKRDSFWQVTTKRPTKDPKLSPIYFFHFKKFQRLWSPHIFRMRKASKPSQVHNNREKKSQKKKILILYDLKTKHEYTDMVLVTKLGLFFPLFSNFHGNRILWGMETWKGNVMLVVGRWEYFSQKEVSAESSNKHLHVPRHLLWLSSSLPLWPYFHRLFTHPTTTQSLKDSSF